MFTELKIKLRNSFKNMSPSPIDVVYIDEDYAIIKYEEPDPDTGARTGNYFYMIVTILGTMTDSVSYQDYELSLSVLKAKAMNNMQEISKIVEKYNRDRGTVISLEDEERGNHNIQLEV